ncbi:MAG: hypothetical protein CMJ49_06680 [Planctomycetaceae bacterium]|nr:hypothetical protein [Planctomycetaceae bacterium]
MLDRHAYQVFAAKTRYGQRIYWMRLAVELSLVIVVTATCFALLRTRRSPHGPRGGILAHLTGRHRYN